MKQNDKIKNYDDEISDIDEIDGVDIKINPDFYIHKALLKAQDALAKDSLQEGFLQYRQFIEYIEVLCKAADIAGEEYTKALDEYKKTKEYTDIKNDTVKSMKLANKKLYLMMRDVFSAKTATFKLKA